MIIGRLVARLHLGPNARPRSSSREPAALDLGERRRKRYDFFCQLLGGLYVLTVAAATAAALYFILR